MSTTIATASCGPYELVAQHPGSLHESDDGAVELVAERHYLVRLHADAARDVLAGALTVPRGGSEGLLHFGNFVGIAELGGRRLVVRSNRLPTNAAHEMLDAVAEHLASLPFGATAPTAAFYARDRNIAPDALYHAFAFLRDGLRARGRHDLPGAIERILSRPHEALHQHDAQLVPLAAASQIDAATLAAIQSEPELLSPIGPESPLAAHPLARRLKGRMPELVRIRPLARTTDNRENRFVVAALDAMIDITRRFGRFASASRKTSSATNAQEAVEIAERLERWRRHRTFEQLKPERQVPINSTVLRGRAGYRELLGFYSDLLARTRLSNPHDMHALLELRDAALIYEYWCYFRVVEAVGDVLGQPARLGRLAVTPSGTHVPYGYRADWGLAEVLFNVTYSKPATGSWERGRHSYSVRLRPDVTLRAPGGEVHLFDAKLKLELSGAFASEDIDDGEAQSATFKRDDLYKMHAYRDALGCDSVWILYPGSIQAPSKYPVPWPGGLDQTTFRGVGAIALRPGAQHDGGLRALVEAILKTSNCAREPTPT